MIVLAVASGTSADGLDVGVVDLRWAGSVVEAELLGSWTDPWPAGVRESVLALLPPASTTAAEVCAVDQGVGRAVAGSAVAAQRRLDVAAELVVSPGQTVHHEVVGDTCLGTLQLGQPAWVAEATGLPVVSDLRARDVAAGGHGAPLAAVLDRLWLTGLETRIALNLGGIANVTVVGERTLAWDTGPGNCLLDVAAARATDGRLGYDDGGALAASGRVDDALLARMLDHPYFRIAPPKTTGRETFTAAWLDDVLRGEPWPDVLATLVELTARTVADAVLPHHPAEVVVSGGGAANPVLTAALARHLDGVRLVSSEAHGLPAGGKEAVLWALLGFLAWHQVPTSTGAHPARVLGRLTPGAYPLVLPSPAGPPSRLVID